MMAGLGDDAPQHTVLLQTFIAARTVVVFQNLSLVKQLHAAGILRFGLPGC
jgi:hypothetical protein